jgi:tRNA G46 methylase TrmB
MERDIIMRLRNIPGADDVIKNHPIAIKQVKEQKGKWHALFENENPIHIEIGMGKGQFILNLANGKDELRIERNEIKEFVNYATDGRNAERVVNFIIDKAQL